MMYEKCKKCAKRTRELDTYHVHGCPLLSCEKRGGFPDFEPIEEKELTFKEIVAKCETCDRYRGVKYGKCTVLEGSECRENGFNLFKPIIPETPKQIPGSCKHHECKECTNRRVEFDPDSSTHLQQSCYDKIDNDPELEIPDGWCWKLGCKYTCPLKPKPELVKEKPELVKCRDCKHRGTISHYINDDFDVADCKIGAESRSRRYGACDGTGVDINVERECTGFEQREPEKTIKENPELVACKDCQNAKDIRKFSRGGYRCTCAKGVVKDPFIDKMEPCDEFVKKTCNECKFKDKRFSIGSGGVDQTGVCYSDLTSTKLRPGFMCNSKFQPELGRYAWEPMRQKHLPEAYHPPCGDCEKETCDACDLDLEMICKNCKENCKHAYDPYGGCELIEDCFKKKEPETGIEWTFGRDCKDCKQWTEHGIVVQEPSNGPVMYCNEKRKKSKEYYIKCACGAHHYCKGPCDDYEKREPEKEPELEEKEPVLVYEGCRKCEDYNNAHVFSLAFEGYGCGKPTCEIKKKEPGKEPEKEKSWEANCGDCINVNVQREYRGLGGVFCGHNYKIKGIHPITKDFERGRHPDFHDCEGYTPPEGTTKEPEKSCATCALSTPKKTCTAKGACDFWSSYIPRSCENCGRGGWNNLCDFPLHEAIKCRNKTWRSWTPRVKDIPEKESSTAHYLTNDYISKRYFEGEPVPGDNTITEGRNEAIKNHVDMVLNTYLGFTEVINDETGILLHIAGELYHNGLEDKNIELTLDHERALETVRGIEYSKKLKTALENGDYVLIPSEESKENKKKNEEVTEMDKSEEKFPFTCPECGAGDYQRENYCAHCGHEFVRENLIGVVPYKFDEQGIKNAHHLPNRKEKTRKAVRVRDTTNAFLSVILYWLTATIVYGMVLIPNVPDFMDEGIVHVILLEAVLVIFVTIIGVCAVGRSILGFDFVDVPRVPVMDRIRAWRQARKDNRVTKLEDKIQELETVIIEGEEMLRQSENNYRRIEESRDRWKQTTAETMKQHEQDIKDLTEERDAMVNTILDDRDENWIPLESRIPLETDQITTQYLPRLYPDRETQIVTIKARFRGDIPNLANIMLFSADVIKKDTKGDD
jgi:hypothetical protein